MLKDKMVRIRLKKFYKEQKPFSYVGKVSAWSENWIAIEGKGIMLSRQSSTGVQIDGDIKVILVPRESIETIQVLPDSFNISNIRTTTEGQQVVLIIDDKRSSFLGEIGEG
ncbi:MAG: hypothetical protein N3G21_03875 [Candidatus Hydrogenedentes bacterium]|nr:hypothetical protein [Candidatus Hydrogenedentota bacterium]